MSQQTVSRKPKRGKRIMDPEEREQFIAQRRAEDRERLEAAVAELASSEGWKRWLSARSRFHNYSVGNCLLIALQCPHATQVASLKTWNSLGRRVVKGERGIRILAPMTVSRAKRDREQVSAGIGASVAQTVAANRPELGDETETRVLFKSVAVFDISQTDGEPLPEPPVEPITGDSHAEYLEPLERFAAELGFSVTYTDDLPAGVGGSCNTTAKRILVKASAPANARVRTLVHELAHALGVGYADYGREAAEVIVESAATIVLGSLGLDTSGESVPYIAGWGDGDVKALREYAAKVDELASRLEQAVGIK